mmetsp:Transcript_59668/g.110417  ORF Transcript_59668/g.110417 Transcript_59668/m.110417 type:complete len:380 (+) Transcript_59668:482-1621(+)
MDVGDISSTPSWMTPTKKDNGIFRVQKINVHQSTVWSSFVSSGSNTMTTGTMTTSKVMARAAIISQNIRLGEVGIAMKCRSAPVYFTSGMRSISCNFLSKFAMVKRPLDFTLIFLWFAPGIQASLVAKLCVLTPSSPPSPAPTLTKERARSMLLAPLRRAGGNPVAPVVSSRSSLPSSSSSTPAVGCGCDISSRSLVKAVSTLASAFFGLVALGRLRLPVVICPGRAPNKGAPADCLLRPSLPSLASLPCITFATSTRDLLLRTMFGFMSLLPPDSLLPLSLMAGPMGAASLSSEAPPTSWDSSAQSSSWNVTDDFLLITEGRFVPALEFAVAPPEFLRAPSDCTWFTSLTASSFTSPLSSPWNWTMLFRLDLPLEPRR